jgi:very-short-patch-repair endonuclease
MKDVLTRDKNMPGGTILKDRARLLRKQQTPWELKLWGRLRKRGVCDLRFLRQRVLGNYILDFYAPSLKLAIELDGSQHFHPAEEAYDQHRDDSLRRQSITVLRFSNLQIEKEFDVVLEAIRETVERLRHPPAR